MQEILDAFGGDKIHLGETEVIGIFKERLFSTGILLTFTLLKSVVCQQDSEKEGCQFEEADIKHFKKSIVSQLFSRTNGSVIVYSGDVADNANILQVSLKVTNIFCWANSIIALTWMMILYRAWSPISATIESRLYHCARRVSK